MEVITPFNGEVVGKVSLASTEDAKKAIESAHQVFHKTMKKMPAYRRATIFSKAANLLEEKTEEFAKVLVLEAGKPIRDGRGEVGCAVQVIRFAADEGKKLKEKWFQWMRQLGEKIELVWFGVILVG